MTIDDLHAQHAMHNIYALKQQQQQHDNGDGNAAMHHQLLSESTQHWLLILLIVVSFAMMGYVFTLVKEQERKEQKNK